MPALFIAHKKALFTIPGYSVLLLPWALFTTGGMSVMPQNKILPKGPLPQNKKSYPG
jgi:hypothetical protein